MEHNLYGRGQHDLILCAGWVDWQNVAALTIWEAASVDPTKHPDYLLNLRQEILQKLVSFKLPLVHQ